MSNQFPSAIQRELLFARMAAARERAAEIRPGPLLLGLIMSRQTLVGRMLAGVPIEQARAALSSVPPTDGAEGRQDVVESAETEQVLRRAAGEAAALGQTPSAEHLLIAREGAAAPDRREWPWRLAMSARHSPAWLRRMPDLAAPPRLWRKQA